MPLTGFDLRDDDSGYASQVGVDAHGVLRTVVPHLHLGSPLGAVEREAEVVARLPVCCPPCLQVQRRASREADKGRGQVFDLVGVADYCLGIPASAAASRTELGVGGAADALDLRLAHQVKGHIDQMDAQIYKRAAPG